MSFTDRAVVLGCQIDRVDMPAAVERCRTAIAERRFIQHMAINVAKLVALQDDAELRAVVESCELVTADGQGVVWASRLLGDPLPTRVAGVDLMWELFELSEHHGYRPYILGARQEVLETALARIRDHHPQLELAGWRDGYFDESEDAAVASDIAATRPDILLVAMSSPRKEYFLGRHGKQIGAPFVMGVGGAIDVAAGITRRAPRLLQRLGLEWLFRLLQEPRRMFRRYLTSNVAFARLLLVELARRRPGPTGDRS